jgi:predicted esterase
VLLMMVMKVLYKENRAERKQLLDDMVIGTPEAFPLPQLTQENFLVVWGEYDQIFNISLAYELQKHLGTQRAEIVVMKNCGHAPQIENPREYNRIILNFLQSPAEKSTND